MRTRGKPSHRLLRMAAVGVALVAGGLHLLFWYAPRERVGVPTGLGARVLGADRLPLRFWIAYPHQNVGKLAAGLPDFDGWVAAAARLSGASVEPVPGFGPFRMPPASGLAVALNPDSGSFLAGAEVYPLVALLARLAGTIASNPWLAGGEVEIQGRKATVGWEGLRGWWLVSDGEKLPPALAAAGPVPADALAWIRTTRAIGLLPAGELRIARLGGKLQVSSTDVSSPPDPVFEAPQPILVLLTSGSITPAGHGGVMLWADGQGRLPALAVLNGPGGSWSLPAAGLLSLVGDGPATATAGALQVRAYDRETAERVAVAVPNLGFRSLVSGTRALDAWIDPAPAASTVGLVRAVLEAFPLVAAEEVQRWRDLETVLRPLAAQGPISLRVDHDLPGLWLRFEP